MLFISKPQNFEKKHNIGHRILEKVISLNSKIIILNRINLFLIRPEKKRISVNEIFAENVISTLKQQKRRNCLVSEIWNSF